MNANSRSYSPEDFTAKDAKDAKEDQLSISSELRSNAESTLNASIQNTST